MNIVSPKAANIFCGIGVSKSHSLHFTSYSSPVDFTSCLDYESETMLLILIMMFHDTVYKPELYQTSSKNENTMISGQNRELKHS